ncbi:ATP-binding protein [Klebsiella michiganensis]|uniref:ATP-binding protein n=1 Tax=Klebsiella TaxID=570 RepID=UPI000DE6D4F7|nr:MULTISPECIES: ATP-binding protein [Klebsiella]SSG25525.1 transposase/IS protein [Klebsiella pneumoniae]
MPNKRIAMRKTRDILRLRFEVGLSFRQISQCADVSTGAIQKMLKRLEASGVSWPLPERMTEPRLASLLYPESDSRPGALEDPDRATIHMELRKKGVSRADGSYRKQLTQLSKTQLLIPDDWGLEPLLPAQLNDLLELMDDRYGKNATVMISQLPTDEWYGCVGDNTLADAILDRLMHNSHRLEMKGESMKKRLAQVD